MNRTLQPLDQFIAEWRKPLESAASVRFESGPLPGISGAPFVIADTFIEQFGFKPIGYNWEMLETSQGAEGERSALLTIQSALESHMLLPSQAWLGEAQAGRCAQQFCGVFTPGLCTILANRMDFGWHPLTNATAEWAFVGFDDEKIALLLLTAEG